MGMKTVRSAHGQVRNEKVMTGLPAKDSPVHGGGGVGEGGGKAEGRGWGGGCKKQPKKQLRSVLSKGIFFAPPAPRDPPATPRDLLSAIDASTWNTL